MLEYRWSKQRSQYLKERDHLTGLLTRYCHAFTHDSLLLRILDWYNSTRFLGFDVGVDFDLKVNIQVFASLSKHSVFGPLCLWHVFFSISTEDITLHVHQLTLRFFNWPMSSGSFSKQFLWRSSTYGFRFAERCQTRSSTFHEKDLTNIFLFHWFSHSQFFWLLEPEANKKR